MARRKTSAAARSSDDINAILAKTAVTPDPHDAEWWRVFRQVAIRLWPNLRRLSVDNDGRFRHEAIKRWRGHVGSAPPYRESEWRALWFKLLPGETTNLGEVTTAWILNQLAPVLVAKWASLARIEAVNTVPLLGACAEHVASLYDAYWVWWPKVPHPIRRRGAYWSNSAWLLETEVGRGFPSTILRAVPRLVSSSVETTLTPARMRSPARSQHDRHNGGTPGSSTEMLRPRGHAIHFLLMMVLPIATIVDASPLPASSTTISTAGGKTSSGPAR